MFCLTRVYIPAQRRLYSQSWCIIALQSPKKIEASHRGANEMEGESKKSYCYVNVHHGCEKGVYMPSHAECKSCMVEAFEKIVRSHSAE